jgi:hypothetical protein
MSDLETVMDALRSALLDVEIWVDGSFVTEKIDPEDVDLVVPFPGEAYDLGTVKQRETLEWLSGNTIQKLRCDSYVFAEFGLGHPQHQWSLERRAYWLKQFGFDRSGQPKGMALLRTNV